MGRAGSSPAPGTERESLEMGSPFSSVLCISLETMKYLLLTCSALLLLALTDMPIGYYTLLRIVVSLAAGFLVVAELEANRMPWVIVFGLIGIIFNPLIPIYLQGKDNWIVIDLLAAVLFIFKALTSPKEK